MKRNEYIPYMATIKEISEQTSDIKSFVLEFDDPELRERWTFSALSFGSTSCLRSPPHTGGDPRRRAPQDASG